MQRELSTQVALVNYLTIALPIPHKVIKLDNEGRRGKGNKSQEGFVKGAADLILLVPKRFSPSSIWIETKTLVLVVPKTAGIYHFKATKQTPAQIEFQMTVEALGHPYWLAPSVDTLALHVEQWCQANGLKSRISENDRKLLLLKYADTPR